jgi:2,4-didehydro-3-deoxy-L-rhamnonate hydrolase
MTFRLATVAGEAALVDDDGNWHGLSRASGGRLGPDPMAALADVGALHEVAGLLGSADPDGSFADARSAGLVGPPVPRPVNCFAVGLNYRDHAAETNAPLPANPLVFTKFPTCLVGPDADIELNSDTADWEVELVVAIGPGGRDITAEKAWDHVAGLMVGQDISDRALQFAASPPHFDLGKSRDTYGPIGPVLVSPDLLDDPDDVALTCEVNGVRRQDDRTSNLIFDVSFLIAYLSSILTLQPGDLLFTGTPQGVGMATGTSLTPGDVVTSSAPGIGELKNRCR